MLRCRICNNGNSEDPSMSALRMVLQTLREDIKVTKRVFKIRKNSDYLE